MLIYSFTVHDTFDTAFDTILEGIPEIVQEQADYEGDWPEKYEITVTMPPEITEMGKRYYFHVWG